jgi:hypothetical protein
MSDNLQPIFQQKTQTINLQQSQYRRLLRIGFERREGIFRLKHILHSLIDMVKAYATIFGSDLKCNFVSLAA